MEGMFSMESLKQGQESNENNKIESAVHSETNSLLSE